MFAAKSVPPQIDQFRNSLHSFRSDRQNPGILDRLLERSLALHDLHTTSVSLISFHDIFESYKGDDELASLIDQLVASLQNIIAEGQDHLNSRLERDLSRLLDQIRNTKSRSLYEWGAWAEVVGRMALEIAGQSKGIPGAPMLVDLAKLAFRVRKNIACKYQQGERELVRLLEIKQIGTDLDSLPNLDDASITHIATQVDSGPPLMIEEFSTAPPSSSETPHPPASAPASPSSGSPSPPP